MGAYFAENSNGKWLLILDPHGVWNAKCKPWQWLWLNLNLGQRTSLMCIVFYEYVYKL